MITPVLGLFIINACVHFFLFGVECYSKCKDKYTVPLHTKIVTCFVVLWMVILLLVMFVNNFDELMWKDWTIFCGLLIFSAWSTSSWKEKE